MIFDEELGNDFGVVCSVALVDFVPCQASYAVDLEWCGKEHAIGILQYGKACGHGCSKGSVASVIPSGERGVEN